MKLSKGTDLHIYHGEQYTQTSIFHAHSDFVLKIYLKTLNLGILSFVCRFQQILARRSSYYVR